MEYLVGAINKETNKYEKILFVEKSNKYKCVGCAGDLILRKGNKNFQSFIHKPPNTCEYFRNPTDAQLLLDAKMFLAQLIESNNVDIYRKCKFCKLPKKINLDNYNETKNIKMDYSIETHQFDLVYFDSNSKIICVFSIYNGEKQIQNNLDSTLTSDYPCYQINLMNLVYQITRSFATNKIELICTEYIVCDKCTGYL